MSSPQKEEGNMGFGQAVGILLRRLRESEHADLKQIQRYARVTDEAMREALGDSLTG